MTTDPDFLKRPRSNLPPPDGDIPAIRSFRQKLQAGIDLVNKQIEALIAQRKELEDNLHQCDSLLSPVNRLPSEVLFTIFELVVTMTRTDSRLRGWYRYLPKVLPSAVCQRWRLVAIESPKLWSTILMTPPEHPGAIGDYNRNQSLREEGERRWEKRMRQLLDVLPLWFERSKECPLSIIIRFNAINRVAQRGLGGDPIPRTVVPWYRELVHLACSAAYRWKDVDIDILTEYNEILLELFELTSQSVPQLCTASLQTSEIHGRRDSSRLHQLELLGVGSLRSAALMHLDRRGGSWNQLPIRWATLKELQIGAALGRDIMGEEPTSRIEHPLGPRSFLALLEVCPALERCELAVTAFDDPATNWPRLPSERQTTLKHLHLNSLILHGGELVEGVFQSLDLPSLQQLHFFSRLIAGEPREATQVLRERFMYSVRRFGLHLTDVRFNLLLLMEDREAGVECFQNLPNLVTLHLDGSLPRSDPNRRTFPPIYFTASSTIIELLTPKANGERGSAAPPCCPRLERFACTMLMKGFTEGQLVDFIAARAIQRTPDQPLITRIKEIDVSFGILQEMNVREEVEKQGVDMSRVRLRVGYPTLF